MSDSVIRVENLSKRYIIGHQRDQKDGLRHRLEDTLRLPVQWLHKLRAAKSVEVSSTHSHSGNSEEFWALRDVAFEVKQGEVVGIIGRNGAGKSTLLKILSRITEPTSGRVHLKGRVASLLEVGTGFHQELTGRENIFLNGAILGMQHAEIRRKFDEIVAFSEVEKFLDTPVKRYSSGMYVRLAFSVAAHLEPEILIVDEVLAVGDFEFQRKCLGKMSEVAHGGRTVLFVSHNISAVRSLCSHGIMIQRGSVAFDGPVDEAIALYSNQGEKAVGSNWISPNRELAQPLRFERIQSRLEGRQPDMRLVCDIALHCSATLPKTFIAADISDFTSTPVMQALPRTEPFMDVQPGLHGMKMEICLPGLIPGAYSVDFWIGTSFDTTMDHIKGAISFEITESPSPNRRHPHSPGHGFMVPNSTCEVIEPYSLASQI